jgi:hypothetical protein
LHVQGRIARKIYNASEKYVIVYDKASLPEGMLLNMIAKYFTNTYRYIPTTIREALFVSNSKHKKGWSALPSPPILSPFVI